MHDKDSRNKGNAESEVMVIIIESILRIELGDIISLGITRPSAQPGLPWSTWRSLGLYSIRRMRPWYGWRRKVWWKFTFLYLVVLFTKSWPGRWDEKVSESFLGLLTTTVYAVSTKGWKVSAGSEFTFGSTDSTWAIGCEIETGNFGCWVSTNGSISFPEPSNV